MDTLYDTRGSAGTATADLPLGSWIFSIDDHLLETSCDFRGRAPRKYRDQVPCVVDHDGGDAWLIDGVPVPITINDGSASWPMVDRPRLARRAQNAELLHDTGYDGAPETSQDRIGRNRIRVADDFRRGVYDVDARIEDMTADGVWASVLIPSITFGFAGQRFSLFEDAEAGLAAQRAYNDWLHDEVSSKYPDRLVCSQAPWLRDPTIAAAEVRRNAARGFTAMLFPENPERFGFPSIHTRHWDPVFDACAETDTVLNIHLGTGLKAIQVSSDSPLPVAKATLAVNPTLSAFDWLFSGIPQRFPNLKIALTEGGIDWVPLVVGRVDSFRDDILEGYWDDELSPAEVLLRNFYFAALFDIGAYDFLFEHCPTHVMLETDFPHGDTFWPDSQRHFAGRMKDLDPRFRRMVAADNAAALYRRPLPPPA